MPEHRAWSTPGWGFGKKGAAENLRRVRWAKTHRSLPPPPIIISRIWRKGPCLSFCPKDDTASGLHLHRQTLPQCRLAGKDGKLLPGLSPSAYTNTHTHNLSFGSLGNCGVGVNRVHLSPVQELLHTPQPKGHSASGPWALSQTALAFCVAEAEEGGASNNRTSGKTVLRDPTVCPCAPAKSNKPNSTEMLCMDDWRGPSFPESGTGQGQEQRTATRSPARGQAAPPSLTGQEWCLPTCPAKGPRRLRPWWLLFPLLLCTTAAPGDEGRSGRAEAHVERRVPASPPSQAAAAPPQGTGLGHSPTH